MAEITAIENHPDYRQHGPITGPEVQNLDLAQMQKIATMCGGTMANYWRIIYRDGSKSGLERNNPLKGRNTHVAIDTNHPGA